MKVMCIADGWYVSRKFLGIFPYKSDSIGPKFGDECVVVGQFYNDGISYYVIQDWSGDGSGFDATQFVPMEEEKEQTEAALEDDMYYIK